MTETEAVLEIKDVVPVGNEPVISDAQIKRVLRKRLRYGNRANSTTYSLGDKVVFTPSNGRVFEVITAGISGSTSFSVAYITTTGATYSDGTVIWRDAGPAHVQNYDITGAIGDVWRLKAFADSSLIDMSDKDTKIMITARRDNALSIAARYPGIWLL